MPSEPSPTPVPAADRLRAAAALLEEIVRDRTLLDELSVEERTRLLTLAGEVYAPDLGQRRKFFKQQRRQRKAKVIERDQAARAETGIRKLRQAPVFTTPNYLAPAASSRTT